jgi:hypothetical protein
MSHKKLAEIVVRSIEYFELADNSQLDPDTAINILECISADLAEATPEEQAAVEEAAKDRRRGRLYDTSIVSCLRALRLEKCSGSPEVGYNHPLLWMAPRRVDTFSAVW